MPRNRRNQARREHRERIHAAREARVYEPECVNRWDHPKVHAALTSAGIATERVVVGSYDNSGYTALCVNRFGEVVWHEERGVTAHREQWPSLRVKLSVLAAQVEDERMMPAPSPNAPIAHVDETDFNGVDWTAPTVDQLNRVIRGSNRIDVQDSMIYSYVRATPDESRVIGRWDVVS